MPGTLVHLVSGESLQNLLPVLALEPDRVVQVVTTDPSLRDKPAHIESAARRAGCAATTFKTSPLQQVSPTVEEAFGAVSALLRQESDGGQAVILNFTGGTKMLSTGAYLAARDLQVPTLYCDTRHRRFVTSVQPAWPGAPPDLPALASRLDVPLLVEANGVAADSLKHDVPDQGLLDFGAQAYPLWKEHAAVLGTFIAECLRAVFKPDGKMICGDPLRAAVEMPIQTNSDPVKNYFDLAADCGVLIRCHSGYQLADVTLSNKKMFKAARDSLEILEGKWLELYCCSLASNNPDRFRDRCWSLKSANHPELEEIDLVCTDADTMGLLSVSAKNTLPSVEHIESHVRRSATLGGSHAERVICATPDMDSHRNDIPKRRELANALDCNLLFWDEIADFFQRPAR